ncbi:MAG: hypothetical protein ACK2UW_17105 [Anaerolineales bacterium]
MINAKELLGEYQNKHPECQQLYRWCIEGCGLMRFAGLGSMSFAEKNIVEEYDEKSE